MKLILPVVLICFPFVVQASPCTKELRENYEYGEKYMTAKDSKALLQSLRGVEQAVLQLQIQFQNSASDFQFEDVSKLYSEIDYRSRAGKSRASGPMLTLFDAFDRFNADSSKLSHNFAPFYVGFLSAAVFIRNPNAVTLGQISIALQDFKSELTEFASVQFDLSPSIGACDLEGVIAQATGRNQPRWDPPAASIPYNIAEVAGHLFPLLDSNRVELVKKQVAAAQIYPANPWQSRVETSDAKRLVEILYSLGTSGVTPLQRFESELAQLLSLVTEKIDSDAILFPRRSLARKLLLILDSGSIANSIMLHDDFENMAKALNYGFLPKRRREFPYEGLGSSSFPTFSSGMSALHN